MASGGIEVQKVDAVENLMEKIAEFGFSEEAIAFLKQFMGRLVEAAQSLRSDALGVGLNHLGNQRNSFGVPQDIIRLLQVAQVVLGNRVMDGALDLEALRNKMASNVFDELKISLNTNGPLEVMQTLVIFLDRFFVCYYQDNGGGMRHRAYSSSSKFTVPEGIVEEMMKMCLKALKNSLNENLSKYIKVFESWLNQIKPFVGNGSVGFAEVEQQVMENHALITPELIERDLKLEKDRITALKQIEDEAVKATLMEQRRTTIGQIEALLSDSLGVKKGEKFEGVPEDTNLEGVFQRFQDIATGNMRAEMDIKHARRDYDNPDQSLAWYQRMYNHVYGKGA